MTADGTSVKGVSKMAAVVCVVLFFWFWPPLLFICQRTSQSTNTFRAPIPFVSRMERSELPLGLLSNSLVLECVCELPKPQNKAIKLKGEQTKMR